MARFNIPTVGTKTVNLAGGEAYKESPELELVSILLTSFAQDKFYRSANSELKVLEQLLLNNGHKFGKFAAKAAVYARNEFGMRSISHVVAGLLANLISGTSWGKDFYKAVVRRPDDMMEIFSYYKSIGGNHPTNAMKKGFAAAFDKFDAYQLAKYRAADKEVSLVDIVNLVHPTPTERNKGALNDIVRDRLRAKDTWESMKSKEGKEGQGDTWRILLSEGRLGYFAVLRNLRNIAREAPDMVGDACEQLTDEDRIKGSLVLPFRLYTAYKEISKSDIPSTIATKIMIALSSAIDISLSNVPKFEGSTAVVLDESGSMTWESNRGVLPCEIGALFAVVLAEANESDLYMFAGRARKVNINPLDSTMGIVKQFRFKGGGTNFKSIFPTFKSRYDRVIVLSDMQGWMGHNSPVYEVNKYKNLYQCNPHIYSIDLTGYGTLQFPEHNTYCIAGFSDKIFDLMKLLEQDKNVLINTINNVEL